MSERNGEVPVTATWIIHYTGRRRSWRHMVCADITPRQHMKLSRWLQLLASGFFICQSRRCCRPGTATTPPAR
ncbi:hypothetical protein IMZ48_27215 [Candidatus Bathyarchaeota archaeon]|nr:hypothetical protein [Candidatus Bathyarchaeota archaeon]